MENGKGAEAGTSSACVVVVVGGGDEKPEKQSDGITKNPDGVCDDDDEVVVGDEENDDEKDEQGVVVAGFVPGPLVSLKEQLDKDKEDESLKRWKEKLLGSVETDLNGQMEPEVSFHSIGIISNDVGEINTPLPIAESQSSRVLFTLKEGSHYRLKLTFTVQHNIVSGLTYSNTVWKGGLQVDQSKGMLGTFAPQRAPYVHTLDEETTPSGLMARGIYAAKLKEMPYRTPIFIRDKKEEVAESFGQSDNGVSSSSFGQSDNGVSSSSSVVRAIAAPFLLLLLLFANMS